MGFWRPQPGARPGAAEGRKSHVILVADDDRDTRELYRAFFDLNGFRTAEATNGGQTVLLARQLMPDVLLTDLVLPDVDGLTVARTLKDDPETAGIRVVMVTGYAFEDLDCRAARAGIERALIKPCLPHAVLREVQRVLARPSASGVRSQSSKARPAALED